MSIQANVVRRYKDAAKSKGPDIRSKLNNARITLNNIQSQYGSSRGTEVDFDAAAKKIQEAVDMVTSVTFGLHLDEAKKYLTQQGGVVNSLNEALSAAKERTSESSREIGYLTGRASMYLESIIKILDDNPDTEEQKERLAQYMSSILPHSVTSGGDEALLEKAVKLCDEIGKSETSPKKHAFFAELSVSLRTYLDAQKALRSSAAFAYKMLPKAR